MSSIHSQLIVARSRPFHSSLRKNFVWTLAGNLIFTASQWAVLSVLAKLTTPEVVGEYALALAIAAPLIVIANFNIGAILVTDTDDYFRFVDYQFARLVLIGVAFVVLLAVLLIFSFSRELVLITIMVGVIQATDCYSELYFSTMQRVEQMSPIAVSQILRGLLSLGVAACLLYRTRNILLALAMMASIRLCVLFAYDLGMCTYATPVDGAARKQPSLNSLVDIQRVRGIVKTAIPLTIVTFLGSLLVNIPRYFIDYYAGNHDLGIFAAMWSFLTAANMIAIALGQVLFPRLSKLYAVGNCEEFKRLMFRGLQTGVALGIVGVLGSVMVGKQILQLLYRPEYAHNHWLLTALMMVGTVVYLVTLLGCAATAVRSFTRQILAIAVGVGTVFISSAVFVPRLGLWGAVLAAALGFAAHFVGLSLIVRAVLDREHNVTETLASHV